MTMSQEFTVIATREQEKVIELFNAIRKDDTARIKEIAAQGVSLETEDTNGVTPLIYAANSGALASVKALLSLGAKPDGADMWGRPAAHFAAKQGYAEIVELLPPLPADLVPHVSIARQQSIAPAFVPESKLLWAAAERGLAETLAIFAAEGKLGISLGDNGPVDGNDCDLLMHAVASGNAKAVSVLLAAGFDPNRHEKNGKSYLRQAIKQERLDIVDLLLAAGADPYLQHRLDPLHQDKTDLQYAQLMNMPEIAAAVTKAAEKFRFNYLAEDGDYKAVAVMLAQGVPAETYDYNGDTALMRANHRGHVNIVRLLLAHKANPNLPWKYSTDVPLHMSVGRENPETAAALIEWGARTDIPDSNGMDGFTLAKKKDNAEVFLLVSRQRGREIEETLRATAPTVDFSAPAKASFRRKAIVP